MAGRGRFKLPSASQLERKSEDSIKPMSVFNTYKQNKISEPAVSDKDGKEKNTVPKASISSTADSFKPVQKPQSSSVVTLKTPIPSISSTETSNTAPLDTGSISTSTSSTSGQKSGGNTILVNFRQRGNPILKHIRNVAWEYSSIIPDYVMGKANCALYLSLRYHQLHPGYLHNRLKELGKGYDLRVLLAQVDVPDPHHLLKDLAKICILADLTLILAFTAEEAGRYLESYKVYENKPAEALMEKTDADFMSKMNECLTTVKAVNKTDCMTLMASFKSFEGIVDASKEDLSTCAGFGPHKAERLYNVLHEPFIKGRKRKSDSPKKTERSPGSSPLKKPG